LTCPGIDFNVTVNHDQYDRKSSGKFVRVEVCVDKQLIMMCGEDGFALREDTKHISSQMYIAMLCSEGEDVQASSSARLQIPWLDLIVPYHASGVILWWC
jgi:hypothetical protein